MAANELAGKVVIVTGAGRSIGLAIARRFAAEGARVAAVDVQGETAKAAAEGITAGGGEALGLTADVGDAAAVDRMYAAVLDAYGRVDVLVNNAALTKDQRHFFDTDGQWWDDYLRINLTGYYLCIDRAARLMARQGGGCVINLSSGGATRAHRGMVAYDAAKGGVEAMTRALAIELAPYGIRVNALVPGLIATDPEEPEPSRRRRDETVPLGRGGRPEDLAGPAVFLASPDAAYVTGACLAVDGGVLVQQRSPQVDTLMPSAYPDPATI